MLQWCATYLAINRGEYDQALAEIERGFLLDPTPSWSWECHRGDVYMVRGDLAGAERTYLQVIEKAAHPDYVLLAKYRLLALYILQGRVMRASAGDLDPCLEWQGPNGSLWGILNACLRSRRADRAAEYIDRALASSRKLGDPLGYRRWLEWKGVAAIDRHDLGGAETVAAELEISVNASPYAIERRKIEHIRGLIALEKGRYEAAINDLESACARLPAEVLSRWMEFQSWHRYPLALAYFGAGRMGRARAEFERLTRLVGSKLWYGDLYAKSFYWLGKIAEAQKDRKKALENYGKFLEIWKDADAGQPELEDARARLAALGIGAAGGDR
jgi:tetratricopeptide (TPR) repeat protein